MTKDPKNHKITTIEKPLFTLTSILEVGLWSPLTQIIWIKNQYLLNF